MAHRARRVDDLPPEHVVFEPYECFEVLGSGSFGTVYKGCHTNNELAIKIVNLKRLRDLNPRFDPDREWGILEKLKHVDHPNLVRFFGMRKDDDRMLLAMEFCRGGDIESYLKTVKIVTEEDARFIGQQIVAGLLMLRSLGIVHRDLKPGNLFISTLKPRPIVKIGDFGFAKRLGESEAMTDTFCGSPLYVAPEILQLATEGEKYDAFKADLWSLGVILFEMVTGKQPFVGINPASQLKTILASFKQGGVTAPLVSGPLQELIAGLLVLDPAARLDYPAVAAHPWLQLEKYTTDPSGIVRVSASPTAMPYTEFEEDGQDFLIVKMRRKGEPPPTEESLMATLTEVNKVNREQHMALEEKGERIKLLQNNVRQLEEENAVLTIETTKVKSQMWALSAAQEESEKRAKESRSDSEIERQSRDIEMLRLQTQLDVTQKELASMKTEVTQKAMQVTMVQKELGRHIQETSALRAELEARQKSEKNARDALDGRSVDLRKYREEMEALRADLAKSREERDAARAERDAVRNAAATAVRRAESESASEVAKWRRDCDRKHGELEARAREIAGLRSEMQKQAQNFASEREVARQMQGVLPQPLVNGLFAIRDALGLTADHPMTPDEVVDAALPVVMRLRQQISIESFDVGSNVLFFPTADNSQYIAFGSDRHHFLAEESREGLPPMQWYLGCVISKEEIKRSRSGATQYSLTCSLVKEGPPVPPPT